MWSRIKFLSITLVALGLTTVIFSSPTSAWDGDLPACENVPDYTTALKADPRYNVDTISFVVFKRSWSGPFLNGNPGIAITWNAEYDYQKIQISGQSGNVSNVLNSQVDNALIINADGTLTDTGYYNFGVSDVTCITAVHNVVYDSTYTGSTSYPDPLNVDTGTIDAPPSEPCDWWDLVCVAQKIYLSVSSGFTNMLNAFNEFVTNIAEIFVPGADNEDIFTTTFNDLNTTMRAKLGFLTYPFDFIGGIINTLMTLVDSDSKVEWHCGSGGSFQNGVCAGICAPNVLGENSVCLDIAGLEKKFPALWTTIIFIARMVLVIGLIELLRKKYYSIVKA